MCFKVQNPIVTIPAVIRYSMTLSDMQKRLIEAWAWNRIKLTDNYYFYVSWEDWGKILDYEMPNIPKYVNDSFDCEDFGDYLRIMIAKNFGVNTCASVEGWADVGNGIPQRHGWSMFFDGETFYQLESQVAGKIMDLSDLKYKPDEIVMG